MDWRRLSIVLALSTTAAPAVAAEEAPPAFGEAIDVRVVNVEAVVTDRNGERVAGLSAEDFRLLVDGREVPIGYFTEVSGGELAALAGDEGPPLAVTRAPDGRVATGYLVFIDNSFAVASQRNQVLARIEASLSRLRPGDQVAVVAFDGRGLDLLSGWTGDQAAIAAVLERAQALPTRGLQRLAARRSVVQVATADGQGAVVPDPFSPWGLYPEIREAIGAAGAALRGVPRPDAARKVMVLLSGGWPVVSPTTLSFDPFRAFDSPFSVPKVEELFQPLIDAANLLGYTLYPIDVPGLESPSVPAARGATADFAAPGLDRFTATAAESSPIQPLPVGYTGYGWERVAYAGPSVFGGDPTAGLITSEWEQAVHHAFGYLARETGGKEVLNSARLEALERVAGDTRSYYWLGFTPSWQGDGGRHDIRLTVVRPGLTVRARRGYSDLSREAQFALETESLLLFGGASTDGKLKVVAGTPRRKGRAYVELPISLEIPAEALTVLPAGEKLELRATLAMASLDRHGARSRVMVLPIVLALDQAPAPGSAARYQTTIKLRRIDQRLVVALGDATGASRLWTEVAVKL